MQKRKLLRNLVKSKSTEKEKVEKARRHLFEVTAPNVDDDYGQRNLRLPRNITEMLEEEEDNEWERIHNYQGPYLPLSEYDDTDVRYVYADPRTKRLYTLVYNETSESYQIVDIRRRRILAKSSVSAAIFTKTYDNKRELTTSSE
jgi:hypothetical protein